MIKFIIIFVFISHFVFGQNEKCDLISNGEGNALGLKFKSRIPCSLIEKVPQRPNVVKSYTTETFDNGKRVSLVIGVKNIEIVPNKNEIQDFLSIEGLKKMCSKTTKYISSRNLIIDGEQSGELKISDTRESIDGKVSFYGLQYFILYNDKLITITFQVFGKSEKEAKLFFDQEQNSIKFVIGNFVILSKYK
jgi:hypothetical protein